MATKTAKKPTKKAPTPAKKTIKKKAASKKAVPKKAAPTKAVKKAVPKKPPVLAANETAAAINVKMDFLLGTGLVTVAHSSGGVEVGTKDLGSSGTATFNNAKAGDTISITGTCSGSAKLTTDRVTKPLSDSNNPISFTKDISQILRVKA